MQKPGLLPFFSGRIWLFVFCLQLVSFQTLKLLVFLIFTPGMVRLSVVIITLNEEKNLARCLDSVNGVADEIVIIDSFSTDKTQEISSCFVYTGIIRYNSSIVKYRKFYICSVISGDNQSSYRCCDIRKRR